MTPKMGEGGQIWLKCITGDLIIMIRDKNNIFERVENFHADLAWNYPSLISISICDYSAKNTNLTSLLSSRSFPFFAKFQIGPVKRLLNVISQCEASIFLRHNEKPLA